MKAALKRFLGETLYFVLRHPIYTFRYLRIKARFPRQFHVRLPIYIGDNFHIRGMTADFKVNIGADCHFLHEVWLEFGAGATITIGERVNLTKFVVVHAGQEVIIGNDVLVGEFVSIRDSNHAIADSTRPINQQGFDRRPVRIGNDVWIGRGSAVLAGVSIGDHSVVGANSLVNDNVGEYQVVAGSPARVLRTRVSEGEASARRGR